MAYAGVRECAVCAWRADCRLKWRNEPMGALSCPEFTLDLRLAQQAAQNPKEGDESARKETGE
ncbi:MAG: hypothetical protein O2807_09835 [bacterium]|nr:hypothetical protein [bacterium]